MKGRLFVWLQYVLPQHGISRLILHATRVRSVWFKNLLTRGFLKLFQVDMSEAVTTDPYEYPSFNEFFTRSLRPETRPIDADPESLVSPVDGAVSECGNIERDRLIQAKGRDYTLGELLADQPWAGRFAGGTFATIYLAPFNYHRIHMPVKGTLADTVYVPGRLFSVNLTTAKLVPQLFARNERVLTLFDTDFGQLALVLVGALNVGSMTTVWAGDITPSSQRTITRIGGAGVSLDKGAELGRFNMGSTVILLFEPGRVAWHPLLQGGSVVQMGRSIGRRRQHGPTGSS